MFEDWRFCWDDRLLGILCDSEESESGSDFTFESLLFLLFTGFVALLVPRLEVPSVAGWDFNDFFFCPLRAAS